MDASLPPKEDAYCAVNSKAFQKPGKSSSISDAINVQLMLGNSSSCMWSRIGESTYYPTTSCLADKRVAPSSRHAHVLTGGDKGDHVVGNAAPGTRG